MLFLPKFHPQEQDPTQGGWQSSAGHQRANSRALSSSLGDAVPCYVEQALELQTANIFSSDEQRHLNLPVLMDLKKSQGFQRPIQGEVIFHLRCLLGNVPRPLKLLKGPDFPINLLPQRIRKAAFLPGKFRRQILVRCSPLKFISAISVQVNEISLKKHLSLLICNALISSHHWNCLNCLSDRETEAI